jgi:hypothetical protein
MAREDSLFQSQPMHAKQLDLRQPADASIWNSLVPPDRPDLHLEVIYAAERGGLIHSPSFGVIEDNQTPIAVGMVQQIEAHGPALEIIEDRHPLHESIIRMVVCAPAIPSGLPGVYFRNGLSDHQRIEAFGLLLKLLFKDAPSDRLQVAWDYERDLHGSWSTAAEAEGFFPVQQPYGFRLAIDHRWTSITDYLAAMRCRYRKHHRRMQRATQHLDVRTANDIRPWIPLAAPLLEDVTVRQGVYFELPSADFLKEFSQLPGAEMTLCLDRESNSLRGVNLLLRGGALLQNLYVGFRGNDLRVYLSMLLYSVGRAIELGCRELELGQRANEPKLKLGSQPLTMQLYAKHPDPSIHDLLKNLDSATGLPNDLVATISRARRVFRQP